MGKSWAQILKDVGTWAWNIPTQLKVYYAAVILVILGLTLGGVYYARSVNYQPLFPTEISMSEVASVTAELKKKNVTYKIEDSVILVPAPMVAELRFSMLKYLDDFAPGKGLDSLPEFNFGADPATTGARIRKAQEVDLAKALMKIEPIVWAQVNLTLEERSAFFRERVIPSASVLIRLRRNRPLTRSVAESVVAFIAPAVQGLTRQNVTVIDAARGIEVRLDDENDGGRTQKTREVEQELAYKAQSMLTQFLGAGRAIIRVTVQPKSRTVREINTTVTQGTVIDEKTTTKKQSTPVSNTKGVVGATPNTTPNNAAKNATTPGMSTTNEEDSDFKYKPSTKTEEIERKEWEIERMTVAATVDLSAIKSDGKNSISKADLEGIIKKAVGFKEKRDEITVVETSLPGVPSAESVEEDLKKEESFRNTLAMISNASMAMAALVAFVLGFLLLRRVQTMYNAAQAEKKLALEQQAKFGQITEVIEKNPEVLVRVVNMWLKSEDEPPRKLAA